MKTNYKNILLVVVVICGMNLITTTFAQGYQPLPDSNASWLVQESSSEYTTYHKYFLSRHPDDTLIAGKSYTKIYYFYSGDTTYPAYEGAFRTDTLGKIYFMPNGNTPQYPQEETILMDFTKETGDTVYDCAVHNGMYHGSYDFVVDSVRYYPCGPYNLKFLALHSIEFIPNIGGFMPLQWIEKIGCSSGGIFNQPHVGLNSFSLKCNNAYDTLFYSSGIYGFLFTPELLIYYLGTCEYYLHTEEPIDPEIFAIYPNPSKGNIYMSCSIPVQAYEIYDLHGKLVFKELFSTSRYIKGYEIPFRNFNSGLYILKIRNLNKQLYYEKFIIK